MAVEKMSDVSTEEASPTGGKGRPRWLILVVVLVCVLAIGVAIGLVAGGDDGLLGGDSDDAEADVAAPVTSDPGQDAAQPTAPAPAGEALVAISTPPANTLAMMDATKLNADALYEVVFSPFGYGPAQGGSSLVVRLSEATALNPSAQAFDFTGRNVLASVVPGGVNVTDGGTYTATLGFRAEGDLLTPVLRDIAAAE